MSPRFLVALLVLPLATVTSSFAASPRKSALRDFDGDGRADLLWQKDGGYAEWLMDGAAIRNGVVLSSLAGTLRFSGDFDGDGKTDLLMRDPNGRHVVALMNGVSVRSTAIVQAAGLDREAIAVGDFDGDGKTDILWKDGAGNLTVAYMNGGAVRENWSVDPGRSDLSVVAVTDVDGDGRSDILWYAADGSVLLTSFTSVGFSSTRQLIGGGTGWWPVAVGDFNGDGHADIVWRHSDGRHAAWYMDDPLSPQYGLLVDGGTGWSVAFVRDLDGDGRSDLVWRRADGTYAVWLMNGGTPKAYGVILDAGSGWEVIASEDFDGDGRDDLLFRGADGSHAIWLMDGVHAKAYQQLFGSGTGWEAGPATSGCDRTKAGSFRIVNPTAVVTVPGQSTFAYVEREAGACGLAFTVEFNATFTGDATGYAPIGDGTITFADGETGIKAVRVTTGIALGTYEMLLQEAVGALGASAPANGSYTLIVTEAACSGCGPGTYVIQAANNQQIIVGTTEQNSLPPLKAGEILAAQFVYQPTANGLLQVAVGGVSNYVAGGTADLEIAIDAQPGVFPATNADTPCDKRIGAGAQSVGSAVLYGGSFPGACNLTPGQAYYINLRHVTANYANGTTPSCTNASGCALRVQPSNLN
jgi:hypothetical protein